MKTLVTGGLGFVGSNLVEILKKMGDEVTVIDNLSSESSSIKYRIPKVEYIISDINTISKNEKLRGRKFDRIFHLAAEARIQPSFTRPLDYIQTNIYGTGEICEFARLSGCKSFVYATTSSKNHGTPYLTPYTYSKVAGEGIVKTYANCFDMNMAMCTFYNVYGPKEPEIGEWATVVAKFLRQWKNSEFLTIVGDGEQSRDFTHVEDICLGMIAASEGNWRGENFDLGKGQPIKIKDLASMISDNVKHVPLRKNEGLHTLCDVDLTFEKLGWKAKHNLNDYIENYKNKKSPK
jgi:UDP-glucose 4-epimerase